MSCQAHGARQIDSESAPSRSARKSRLPERCSSIQIPRVGLKQRQICFGIQKERLNSQRMLVVVAGLIREALLLLFKSDCGEQFRIFGALLQRLWKDFFRLRDGMLRTGTT